MANDLATIRKRHRSAGSLTPSRDYCVVCCDNWPCDVAIVLALLDSSVRATLIAEVRAARPVSAEGDDGSE